MAVLKDLIVHGRSRFVNGAQFNTINAESIGATEGIFNKLIATTLEAKEATIDDLTATNATIVGLLDVQGEMHTKSWSNSNIATIDGNFYITPTVVSADGADVTASGYTPTGTLTYSSGNYTQMTIAGTFDTSQLTLDDVSSIDWPANSYVIITGEVSIGKEWYPLGTIRGKLGASIAKGTGAAAKSITIVPIGTQIISEEVGNVSLTDGNGHKPSTLEAIRIAISETSGASLNSLKLRKVKISMTSRASGNDQYALGIYMTAMGSNKKTFLDIYGGSNKNGENVSQTISDITYQSGALAIPTVRIGNLLGLPMVGGITPKGWGIYTNNGFFTGTIVARQGKIGNADQGAWTIGNDSNTGAAYIYVGNLGESSSAYVSTGYGDTSIANSGTLVDGKKWVFTAGNQFGVTNEGDLYASNATIHGDIIAQSLTIQGTGSSTYSGIAAINISGYSIEIVSGEVAVVSGQLGCNLYPHLYHNGTDVTDTVTDFTHFKWYKDNNSTGIETEGDSVDGHIFAPYGHTYTVHYDFDDGAVEGGTITTEVRVDPSKYITQTADTGIQIHPEVRTSVGYIQLDTNGLNIYGNDGTSLASYSSTIRIGPSNGGHTNVTSSGMEVFSNASTSIASFGVNGARIGRTGASHSIIDSDGMRIYSGAYGTDELAHIGYGQGATQSGTTEAPYFTFGSRLSGSTIGARSFASGHRVTASQDNSHAEGFYTVASRWNAHAEGSETEARGAQSHAEGMWSIADGSQSHAEGTETYAGPYGNEHAQNERTKAIRRAQTALGTCNIADIYVGTTHPSEVDSYGHYAVIVGNGTSDDNRSNAFMIDWVGDIYPQATKMVDFIVDQGTSGIWTYRKWNSGISECWGTWSGSLTNYTTVFGGYGYYVAVTFPSNLFNVVPIVTYSADGNNAFAVTGTLTSGLSTTGTNVYAVCSGSGTRDFKFYIRVIGRWK